MIQLRTSMLGAQTEEQPFNPRNALNFLYRQWKIILALTLASLVGTAVWLARTVPLYTASTQVLLDPRKEKAAGSDAILTDVNLDLPTIENEIAIIKSTALLRRVVEKEHLADGAGARSSPPALRQEADSSDPVVSGKSGMADGAKSRALNKISPQVMAAIDALRGEMSVSRVGQGFILAITVTSADPNRAARLANAIADAYIVDAFDARLEAAQRASSWLGDRLEELRVKLRKSEQAVAAYRSEHNLIQVSEDITLNQEQIGQLNNRLVLARAETAEKKARLDLMLKLKAEGGNIRNLPDVAASSALLSSLNGQLAEMSRQEADLTSRYSGRYPQVVTLRAQQSEVERAIGAEVRRAVENMRNDYTLAVARLAALERTLREMTGQINVDNQTAITLRELQRTAAVDKSRFEDFLQRARITEEQATFEARQVRVIVPAMPPGAPSSPKKAQAFTIALVVGLLLGVGGGWGMEKLNYGFTTSRQFEEMLGSPILAAIPRMDARQTMIDGVGTPLPRFVRLRPQSSLSESLRGLRMGIRKINSKEPAKVIQLTSTFPGEGKTTTALMLAASAASSDQKVLIIDANLRDPAASKYFNRLKDAGLTDYLLGKSEIENVIYADEALGLSVLPMGLSGECPPDLLSSERMRKLIDHCRANFDYVVLDTPTVGPVVDALVASSLADMIVFVIRWHATPREAVYQAIARVSDYAKLAGGVFNLVDEKLAKRYGEAVV